MAEYSKDNVIPFPIEAMLENSTLLKPLRGKHLASNRTSANIAYLPSVTLSMRDDMERSLNTLIEAKRSYIRQGELQNIEMLEQLLEEVQKINLLSDLIRNNVDKK